MRPEGFSDGLQLFADRPYPSVQVRGADVNPASAAPHGPVS